MSCIESSAAARFSGNMRVRRFDAARPRSARTCSHWVWHALRERIDQAELVVVTRCLEQVRTYNACFTELPCEAFEDRRQPAWLSGIELAPCGCGVADYAPEPGWIVRRAVLPENLSACEGVLPLQGAPPTPGFACP